MPREEVDLVERQVSIGRKVYWYDEDEDEDEDRLWSTESKKFGHLVDEGEASKRKLLITEIVKMESAVECAPEWTPAKKLFRNPTKIKALNAIVDRAIADKQRQIKESRHGIKSKSNNSTKKHLDSADKREQRGEKGMPASLSVALKSAASDYILNFRVAPSKKRPDLYNVSVHLGSKFLAYVEIPLNEIVELGRRLTKLE